MEAWHSGAKHLHTVFMTLRRRDGVSNRRRRQRQRRARVRQPQKVSEIACGNFPGRFDRWTVGLRGQKTGRGEMQRRDEEGGRVSQEGGDGWGQAMWNVMEWKRACDKIVCQFDFLTLTAA